MATRKTKRRIKKEEARKREARVLNVNTNDLTLNFLMDKIEVLYKKNKNPQTGESLYVSENFAKDLQHLVEKCKDNSDLSALSGKEVIKSGKSGKTPK